MEADGRRPRRWWRKKRSWAAGLLWVATAYLLSLWPAGYAVGRGWAPPAIVEAVYGPAVAAADLLQRHDVYAVRDRPDGGTEDFVNIPDPDPPPWIVVVIGDGYMEIADRCFQSGERHAEEAARD